MTSTAAHTEPLFECVGLVPRFVSHEYAPTDPICMCLWSRVGHLPAVVRVLSLSTAAFSRIASLTSQPLAKPWGTEAAPLTDWRRWW